MIIGSGHLTLFLRQCYLLSLSILFYLGRCTNGAPRPRYWFRKLIRSMLRFKIQDDEIGKDDLAAWACIRLDRLRSGYRFVHLLDGAGFESKGVLLVGIQKTLI